MDGTWRLVTLTLVMALIALGIYALQEQQREINAGIVHNQHRSKQRATKPPAIQVEPRTAAKRPLDVDVLPVEGVRRKGPIAQEPGASGPPMAGSPALGSVPLYTPIEITNAFADNEISANRRFSGVFKIKGYVGPVRFEGGIADIVLYGGGVFDVGTVHCLAEGSSADSFESVHRNQVVIVFAQRAITANGMVVSSNCYLDSLSSAVHTDSGDWVRGRGLTPIEPLDHSQ